jgi:hypothetical protein
MSVSTIGSHYVATDSIITKLNILFFLFTFFSNLMAAVSSHPEVNLVQYPSGSMLGKAGDKRKQASRF